MKNTLACLTATTILAMTGAAFAADEMTKGETNVKYKDNGGYESTQKSKQKNADGTTTQTEANVDVDVDSDGNVSKTVKTENSTDAEGLGNAKSNSTKTEVEEKSHGGYKESSTVKKKDADGTNVTTQKTVDVDVDAKGNVTETVKTEKVVDPEGLMNKEKSVSKTKTVNGRVVEKKTDVK